MSHTPTTTAPPGNAPLAPATATGTTAQQDKDKKPSLTGVRIKQRKRQAQAASKFEPEAFRDALLVHLALIPSPPTTETLVAKLVQAGSTLEFLRYNEQLFEILFIGGLLQPGGSYLDDKRSPVYLLKSEGEWDGVKGMVEVLKRVIQRYKYLQKPLEEDFLPNILGYLGKWSAEDREKLAEATALFIIELQSSPKCLGSLTKEHVSKDGVALSFITSFFKAYLARQNVEHLSATLKRSGLRDLLLLFPIQTRDRKHLEDHFKKENLTPVLDWYNKLALSEVKDETILNITRMVNDDEGNEQILDFLKNQQNEKPVPEAELCDWILTGLMRSLDANTRPDQIDGAVVQLLTARAVILETFCKGAKAEVGLINSAQVYCYTDTRLMKSFAQLLKVLYNSDCVSDQAIIYWHAKGAKPQGKQHFLKATDALVKFLEEQDSDEE